MDDMDMDMNHTMPKMNEVRVLLYTHAVTPRAAVLVEKREGIT